MYGVSCRRRAALRVASLLMADFSERFQKREARQEVRFPTVTTVFHFFLFKDLPRHRLRGSNYLLLLHADEDADADAAEHQQAANCERGTRRTVQAQQGRTSVAVCARGRAVLRGHCKGVAHPRHR